MENQLVTVLRITTPQLGSFVKDKFNLDIPASIWSDKNLDKHLKMRISIRDEKDKEIQSLQSQVKTLEEKDAEISTLNDKIKSLEGKDEEIA